jgi:hypothetical protein
MSTTTAPAPAGASTEHDAKGRFVKGNKGGPGNPLAGKVNRVRKAFLEYFEGEAMHALCEFMLRKALSGDPRFCRLILQYTIGKLPSDDGFADVDDAEVAQAAAEAAAELANQLQEAAGNGAPATEVQSSNDREAAGAVRQPAAANLQPAAPEPTGTVQVSAPALPAVEPAASLTAGIVDFSNRPHSKNRERLLKLLDERDPLRPDFPAVPPSTNGLGGAQHIPLAGT